jgi:hypothetical protein
MKSRQLFLGALAFISFHTHAQSVHFKIRFKPATTYSQTMQQSMAMKFGDDTEGVADVLKEHGMQTAITSRFEMVTKTGKPNKRNNEIPLTTTVTKSENNTGQEILPAGSILYGHIGADEKLALDSIDSKAGNTESTDEILEMVKGIMTQVNMPDTSIKVGDSVIVNDPVSLPLAGMEMGMLVITKYTLISVDNSIAVFDISQNYTSNGSSQTAMMQITGAGKGKMLYDIKNQFYSEYTLDYGMALTMKMGEQEMKIANTSSVKQKISISNNPLK